MAWDWLSPIPGTLNTQHYRPKQSGTSPFEGIAEDPPRSASSSVALEGTAANVSTLGARVARPKSKSTRRMGSLTGSGASKSPETSPCGWPCSRFVPVEQAAGEVEVRRGKVCRLAPVVLKDGPGVGSWAGKGAVSAPIIIEVVKSADMSYTRGPRR